MSFQRRRQNEGRNETSDYHNAARFAFKILDISDFSFRIIASMEILPAFSNPKSPIQNPVHDDFECCSASPRCNQGDPVKTFLESLIVTLLFLSMLAAAVAAEAQQVTKVSPVGMLLPVAPALALRNTEAFRQGLRERGYVEGQNIAIECRFADGRIEPLSDLAVELVRLKMDVIVTWGTPAARAAKQATGTIPIVMAAANDPVENGLVASLARPGGHITGATAGSPELSGKTLELLKAAAPKIRRVAVLWNPDNPALLAMLNAVKAAGMALSVQVQGMVVRDPDEFDSAFAAITRERAGALLVLHEPHLFLTHRDRILDFAVRTRLPVIYERREYVEAGGLMSYGVNFRDNFRRAATFVDNILKGVKPADLPVEQPMKFELVINLKTAKRMGLTISPNFLARADEVIR